MKLVRVGKVKEVYDEGETLLFKFTDKISVFDKIIPSMIPYKGESLCRTSEFWFRTAAQQAGVETHLIERISPTEMRVKKYSVPEGKGNIFTVNFLIPLEFVARYYLAGSLYDRVLEGKVPLSELGLEGKPVYGEKLDDPYLEATTKFEKFDRPLNEREALEIGGLKREELTEIFDKILKIDRRIEKKVGSNGLIHADGKKEFALGDHRQPVVVDTFGTADEDRFWDRKEYENGKIIELSKESVRQYYRSNGYHDKLYEARSKGTKEPDISALPENLISQTSELYRNLFTRITGENW
jgi:phosphoribosylaminoimidazole-succinocarboxamide synthase